MNKEKLNASVRYLNKVGEANLEKMRAADHEEAERFAKLGELLSNEAFAQQFVACADKEAAAKLFAAQGFEITMEELEDLIVQIKNLRQQLLNNDGELSEDALEIVAGGFNWKGLLQGLFVSYTTVLGTLIGTAICPGLGTVLGTAAGAIVGGLILDSAE
jgi:predicted ribosomally synthesized peptide with nif11-like leader